MTAVSTPPVIDGDALMDFVFKAIDEVGASLNTALVVMGDRLGYYKALADGGPMTATALAAATEGGRLGWHDPNTDLHDGCERCFRPGYHANLVAEWLPGGHGLVGIPTDHR